ncbi:unnamed protein product [Angiostrongylus costaricensis]|uniref:Pecanex-like protein n=1 Tax=Angiostrongylus costaricensis TaxID=334426 RepID=A0A158PFH3_ANGCS|nr:unnamed protein product [Angiostrongylus costaricensis]
MRGLTDTAWGRIIKRMSWAVHVMNVYQTTGSSLATEDEDNDLFLSLDREIEDVLGKAIDELPDELMNRTLRNNQGSTNEQLLTKLEFGVTPHQTSTIPNVVNTSLTPIEENHTLLITDNKENVKNETAGPVILPSLVFPHTPKPDVLQIPDDIIVEESELVNNDTSTFSSSDVPHMQYNFPSLLYGVSSKTVHTAHSLFETPTTTLSATTSLESVQNPTTASFTLEVKDAQLRHYRTTNCSSGSVCYKDEDCGKKISATAVDTLLSQNLGTILLYRRVFVVVRPLELVTVMPASPICLVTMTTFVEDLLRHAKMACAGTRSTWISAVHRCVDGILLSTDVHRQKQKILLWITV